MDKPLPALAVLADSVLGSLQHVIEELECAEGVEGKFGAEVLGLYNVEADAIEFFPINPEERDLTAARASPGLAH
jgi:hypothetical protein